MLQSFVDAMYVEAERLKKRDQAEAGDAWDRAAKCFETWVAEEFQTAYLQLERDEADGKGF